MLAAAFASYMGANLSIGPTRIFPVMAPIKVEYPCVAYAIFPGEGPVQSHSATPYGGRLDRVRMQLSLWSLRYADVEALGDEIINLVNGFTGMWGSLAIGSCLVAGWSDSPYQPDTEIYQRSIDLIVQYYAEPGS